MSPHAPGEIDLRVMTVPIGSWLLWTATLLLLGGFGRLSQGRRRLFALLLAATLALHLLSNYWPPLLLGAIAALAVTAFAVSLRRLTSLTLATSLATAAVMVLTWPGAVASGLDPVATAGIGVAVVAAVASPPGAAPASALIGAVIANAALGHSFDGPATFAPSAEQFFQLAATAACGAAALGPLAVRAWALRGRLAR